MAVNLRDTTALNEQEIGQFHDQGYSVMRATFTDSELQRVRDGIYRVVGTAYAASGSEYVPSGKTYPEPATLYQMIGNFVSEPELSWLACHPRILHAVESILGDEAALSAFAAFLKTPGMAGTRSDYISTATTAHQDYKTYHHAGSSLNWLIVVIPLVDYDGETGPLYVSPGSHKLSKIVDGVGRVKSVERENGDRIGPLVDAKLKRGDVLLMHMFTWHEGGANRSDRDRVGLYNKYRALHAPPAAGPDLFSVAAHDATSVNGRSLLPHYSDTPVVRTRAIFEVSGEYLLVRNDENRWELPGGLLHDEGLRNDSGNLIHCIEINTRERLGLVVPWATYIDDHHDPDGLCRIYAYAMPSKPNLTGPDADRADWFTLQQIKEMASQNTLGQDDPVKAIESWLDDAIMRGRGESKTRAAPGRK